uniref:Uncharacterized protein n=1 Tax=Romanomermis culicivorax TaxID=13658 RepID=A0A915K5U2_ROMCU
MRFAEMEYKMTLVRVLREFSIVFGPDSETDDLTVEQQSFLMHPKNGVQIKLCKVAASIETPKIPSKTLLVRLKLQKNRQPMILNGTVLLWSPSYFGDCPTLVPNVRLYLSFPTELDESECNIPNVTERYGNFRSFRFSWTLPLVVFRKIA